MYKRQIKEILTSLPPEKVEALRQNLKKVGAAAAFSEGQRGQPLMRMTVDDPPLVTVVAFIETARQPMTGHV